MKSTWRDFVMSGLLITLILGLSLGVVWLVHPWAAHWLGTYHVVLEVLTAAVSYGLISAATVRLLLARRPMPEGEHALDSAEFAYWKLLTVLYRLGQGSIGWCTPFYMRPVLDALFGARVGSDVAFGGTIDDPYRVTVGDGTVLGNASLITGNYLSDSKLVCGDVAIGARVTIGANCVVMPGTKVGDGAVLMSGSYLMPGTEVPAGEKWRGNPARKWM